MIYAAGALVTLALNYSVGRAPPIALIWNALLWPLMLPFLLLALFERRGA